MAFTNDDDDPDWLSLAKQYIYESCELDGTEVISSTLPALLTAPYELASRSPLIFRFMYAHVFEGGHDARAKVARRTDRDLRGTGHIGISRPDVDGEAGLASTRRSPERAGRETLDDSRPRDPRIGQSVTETLGEYRGKTLPPWQDEPGFVVDDKLEGITHGLDRIIAISGTVIEDEPWKPECRARQEVAGGPHPPLQQSK
ncbi:MAG: hypothetical protein OYK82_09140 [Gammaproteobacteria bacterium]|nr:hypothetical protein [Gammaproteobacteria bacterium]